MRQLLLFNFFMTSAVITFSFPFYYYTGDHHFLVAGIWAVLAFLLTWSNWKWNNAKRFDNR